MAGKETKLRNEKPGLRMKELVEETRLPKSTILYYYQSGLLPEPLKKSRNMAYYPRQWVSLLRFIRDLQKRHRLSLPEIKTVIEKRGKDEDYTSHMELREAVFGDGSGETVGMDEFLDHTGLTAEQLKQLLAARLLMPLESGRFDAEDERIGRMFADAFSWGLKCEDVTYYVELGEKIVEREMALKQRLTRGLSYADDIGMTTQMVQNARLSRAYIIDRLFMRRVAVMKDLKEETEEQA